MQSSSIDLKLALFLAGCCEQAYNAFTDRANFVIPDGYTLEAEFSATVPGKAEEPFGFIIRSANDLVLAFRGTDSSHDWVADAEAIQVKFPYVTDGGLAHKGFTDVYSSCRDTITSNLMLLPASLPLYITGHSLGGALAVLCALDIAVNTSFKTIMYSFAGPRSGDPDFATKYNSLTLNSQRVVNVYDVVPMIPPPLLPLPLRFKTVHYQHVDTEFVVEARKGSIAGNHAISTYIEALQNLEA